MRHLGALPLVAAAMMGSASLPESSRAQSNPYALDRLFLESNEDTPLYDVLSFTSETQVANYYGKSSPEANLATEFYANGGTGVAHMLFTRLPDLPARAHLYGSQMPPLTLQEMQAIHGTLSIFSQSYHYTASINLSGVTSIGAGVKAIGTALNAHLPFAAATTSSITSQLVHFTGSTNAGVLTVSNASPGTIQIGSMIAGKGIPTGTSITNQPQITAQLSGTPGGDGTYALFLREGFISPEPMKDSYGVLTVGSTSSGQVKAGEQVSGTNVLSHTAIEENMSPRADSDQPVSYPQALK